MSDPSPCFALQGDDGQSLLVQTERLRLHAVNNVRKLRLQVRPQTGINPAPLERLLGIALPASPQEIAENTLTAYWLAPNDWLLVNPSEDADNIEVALRASADGATAVVTDVTDAYSIIDVSGEDAVTRLAEGCSVDLDSSVFPPGRYALTRLQHLSVILHKLDDATRFRLLVDRNVARFLWDRLLAAVIP